MPQSASPSEYATSRLQIITAEMCLLDLSIRRYEIAYAASGGDVTDAFHESWDLAVADWWHLAEEAEALSADLNAALGPASAAPAHTALAAIAAAMARMLQASTLGAA